MKINRIETTKLDMPYKKPLVTATNNFTIARGLLVKAVTDEGVEGYGYSDLFPRTGETPESAAHFIDVVLKPKVVNRDLEHVNEGMSLKLKITEISQHSGVISEEGGRDYGQG